MVHINLLPHWKSIFATFLGTLLLFVFMFIIDDDPIAQNSPIGVDGGTILFFIIVLSGAQTLTVLLRSIFLKFYNRANIFLIGVLSNILSLSVFYIVLFSILYFVS